MRVGRGQRGRRAGGHRLVVADEARRLRSGTVSVEVVRPAEGDRLIEKLDVDPERADGAWGKTRAGFSFRTEIDRREWGLKWNQAIETGGVLVANKVRVEGEVQFVRE